MWTVADVDASAAVFSSPMRRNIFESLSDPDSAAGIARRHGVSRQRVGYHMRALEAAGLLEQVGERQQRGCTEKLYRAKTLTYLLGPAAGSDEAQAKIRDRFSWASLMNLLGRSLHDLTSLRRLADAQKKRLPTLAIESEVAFANPAARKAFTDELTTAVQNVIAKHHDDSPDSRRYRLLLGAYPSPPKAEKGETDD